MNYCAEVTCVARGLCTVVPGLLHTHVLEMAHKGHLGIVKLKQCCRYSVWWTGMDKDIKLLVKDCHGCLKSGKTGRCNKLTSFWSAPLAVTHQLGRTFYLLEDGTQWHSSHLQIVPAPPPATPQIRGNWPSVILGPGREPSMPLANK